jgi:DNA-binding GntR family transcriptional regulator
MNPTSTQWGSYARIAEALRVRLDLLPPGSPVPSETVLSNEFGVARNTVRRALALLAEEGLVGTVPGRRRVVLTPGQPAVTLPAYRRIAAELQRDIAAGELAPGDALPSEAAQHANMGCRGAQPGRRCPFWWISVWSVPRTARARS